MNKKENPRNHNIRVRITEEEYKRLQQLQTRHNSPSISHIIRELIKERS